MQQATDAVTAAANAEPGLTGVFTTYRSEGPQLFLDIDREKVQTLNVPISSVFTTLQSYLGTMIAKGAGAEMDQALGTAVFAGMIGVTFFGIFLSPVFFSVIMKIFTRVPKKRQQSSIERREPKENPVR